MVRFTGITLQIRQEGQFLIVGEEFLGSHLPEIGIERKRHHHQQSTEQKHDVLRHVYIAVSSLDKPHIVNVQSLDRLPDRRGKHKHRAAEERESSRSIPAGQKAQSNSEK